LTDGYIGQITKQVEYDPFGRMNRFQVTPFSSNIPFGFSSRYRDEESGYVYFGHRFYNPETARWLSRDPMQENGSVNAYNLLNNDTQNTNDFLGLIDVRRIPGIMTFR